MTSSQRQEDGLLAEQVAYYRARSSEYDDWFLRKGRYDHGPEKNALWQAEVEIVRARLAHVRSELPNAPAVLELACGTGLWTERLATGDAHVTAVDASPEVIELGREKLRAANLEHRVEYHIADLFEWRPSRRYDLVFFSFWLSHVPPSRFDDFWSRVADAMAPGSRVFFVDNLRSSTSGAGQRWLPEEGSTRATRELEDGRQFDIVKVFYEPRVLAERLAELGFAVDVGATPTYFIHGAGVRR